MSQNRPVQIYASPHCLLIEKVNKQNVVMYKVPKFYEDTTHQHKNSFACVLFRHCADGKDEVSQHIFESRVQYMLNAHGIIEVLFIDRTDET